MITFRSKKALAFWATASCLLWGSAFPVLKITNRLLELSDKPATYQILFAGYRFFLAGILTLLYAYLTKLSLRIERRNIPVLIKIGLVQTTIQYLFFYLGLFNTTGINGSIITATGTFFSVILAHFFYHNDSLSLKKALGLGLGFVGVLLATLKGGTTLSFNWLGDGLIMLSSLLGAYSVILAKESSKDMNPVVVSGYQLALGALILIGAGGTLVGFETIRFSPVTGALLLYLSFLSAAAFAIWYTLLRHHPVSKVSIYKFQIPIWGVLLSALMLSNESLRPVLLISLLLVISGIVIVHQE